MKTTLDIDNQLIQEALKLGEHPTKRAVIEAALQEYVERRKKLMITELFGTIEYEDDYDYKQQRHQS
ncbi:MAG: type II toxin-antitoxin system VapB family antitoxin [Crocosphaera sp.]